MLVLSLYGGVLADRYDKRRVLIAVQVAMGVQALALGLLVVSGTVTARHVYVLAAVLGVGTALDVPVRQSFVPEIVGGDDLPNAVGLNSVDVQRCAHRRPGPGGPAHRARGDRAGVPGATRLSYARGVVGLLLMRTAELRRTAPQARRRGQLVRGSGTSAVGPT